MKMISEKFKNALQFVGSGLGIVGGIIGVVGWEGQFNVIGLSITLVIISVALFITLYRNYKRKNTTVIGNCNLPSYYVRSTNSNDLIEIAKLQKEFYPDDAVPFDLYKEWFDKNSKGFFIIESKSTCINGIETKEIVGHFTFLPIKEERMKYYLKGQILETDIRGADLHSPQEMKSAKSIYVESVIIKHKHRRIAVFCLIRMMKSMLDYFCSSDHNINKIFAMAATNDGVKTLKGMHFEKVPGINAEDRKDKHDIFECDYGVFYKGILDRERKFEINLLKG